MFFYIIPLSIISLLAIYEGSEKNRIITQNKFIYIIIAILFILIIGLRVDVGCDWDTYKDIFNNSVNVNFPEIVKNKDQFLDIGHGILTKLISLRFDFYVLNVIYAIFFIIPLFYFCSTFKSKYLGLTIAYPYYIIIVGMGPIRQSLCISFLMLSILFLSKEKLLPFYFVATTSALFHQSSIIFNFISFISSNFSLKNERKIFSYFFLSSIAIIFAFNLPYILIKISSSLSLYSLGLQKANSAIFIWFIHSIPSSLFLLNIKKFSFIRKLKRIIIFLSISQLIVLPFIFINSVFSYRMLLYFFPSSILITVNLVEIEALKYIKNYLKYSIIFLALLSLLLWIKFANHSYCWLPYQNLLFN